MTEKKWNQGCAVWFWRNFIMEYEIFDHEIDAARYAVALLENEEGAPVGLQYSDGRTVKVENWRAYEEAEKVYNAARNSRPPMAPPSTRIILNPFDGSPKRVDAGQPKWLGKEYLP